LFFHNGLLFREGRTKKKPELIKYLLGKEGRRAKEEIVKLFILWTNWENIIMKKRGLHETTGEICKYFFALHPPFGRLFLL
jgi:hypothetical protein